MGQAKYVKNKPLYMPGTLYTNKEGENAMCMMMKDSNDKNKEPMMGPCMGIPGMHGVAIFFDPEEFMKAFEDEEKETDAKMEEDDSEAYSEEDEADEENPSESDQKE